VTARLFWLGPAHAQGDELIFVNPDNALLSGDIVMNKIAPNIPNAQSSVHGWLDILAKLEPLKPHFIVPDHARSATVPSSPTNMHSCWICSGARWSSSGKASPTMRPGEL
jgi:glyoxylase-like metal-dependent hydrolase (beta-lactamase superfamily II)